MAVILTRLVVGVASLGVEAAGVRRCVRRERTAEDQQTQSKSISSHGFPQESTTRKTAISYLVLRCDLT